MMNRGFFKALIVIIVGVIALLYYRTGSFEFFGQIGDRVKSLDNKEAFVELADAIKEEISNPSPLIWTSPSERAHLTKDGVLTETNAHRLVAANLPALRSNAKLDAIADIRLKDMFDKQYFEHINPQGEGASDVAKDVNYQYIAIGENIALGNFEDDKVLVQAWMDSPGHRANILNTKFTEIGIAVATGTYEGRRTWIGVQIFAKPTSECPEVSAILKANVTANTDRITVLKNQADQLAAELEQMRAQSDVDRNEYNKKVSEYNSLVKSFNDLNARTKTLVDEYNEQVRAFNACLKA